MASFSRGPLWLNQLANLRPRNNTDSQRLAAPREGGAVQEGAGADHDLDSGLQGSKGQPLSLTHHLV